MDNQVRYKEYLNFIEKYGKHLGHKGNYKRGEIELVNDMALFQKCEEGAVKLMISLGTQLEDAIKRSKIGLRDENRWGITLCDPLRLPDGSYTTFVRVIPWSTLASGTAGVVIVPCTSDGHLVLIKTFRHNIRLWSIEFPRGGRDPGNSLIKTLKNELSEEIGARILEDPIKLGEIFPDSGILASKLEVFKVSVEITGEAIHEVTEAVGQTLFVTVHELKKMIGEGKIRDGLTLSAFALMGI